MGPVSYTHLDVYKRQALLRTESRGGHTRTDHPRAGAPRHLTLTLGEALADIDAYLEGLDRHDIARSA